MSNNSLEIIHEGWLTKSPPSKPIWRARWRRRWFVLRHSGELPGQYFLEYYTDRNCRKLKGKIDLDQCEQVDAGLRFENRKQKYQHMFDVKTPKRIYYLAAESEEDMNKWVEYVCHVCGLKAYKEDEEEYDYGAGEEEPGAVCKTVSADQEAPILGQASESPPVSPTSTSSGPYIPISECISGKSLSSPNGLEDFHNILRQGGYAVTTETRSWHRSQRVSSQAPALPLKKQGDAQESPQFYDSPRKLHPPNLELQQISGAGSGTPPMQSPTTDGESVFTDDEWTNPVLPPSVNWKTFPNGASDGDIHPKRPSDSSVELDVGTSADLGSWSVEKRFGKLTVVDRPREGPIPVHDRQLSLPTNLHPIAPPRPPKPSHLLKSHNYLNLENVSSRPRGNNFRKTSIGSASSDSSKRTGNAVASTETVSASDGNEEPPSPLSPVTGVSDSAGISDEMYDFPRSHQYSANPSSPSAFPASGEGKGALPNRHCYSNAAPGQLNGNVFCYDFPFIVQEEVYVNEEPVSPCSDGSSSLASSSNVALYSNLPSPQSATEGGPPAVNRCLKPDRKLSDTASVMSNEPSPVSPATHAYPPSVDRKLKPHRKFLDPATSSDQEQPLPLAAPPACRLGSENNRSLKKHRAAPSPTPPTSNTSAQCNGVRQRSEHNSSSDDDHRNSLDEQIYYFQYDNKFIPANFLDVPYVDLDFESDATANPAAPNGSNMPGTQMPKSPERGPPATATVYLKVDFLKTEAFNKTKQRLEEERKKCSAADGL